MTEPATVADRLAAAGVRVRPLVWRWDDSPGNKHWIAYDDYGDPICADDIEGRLMCDHEHAAAVLAMLEVVPSEEPPR